MSETSVEAELARLEAMDLWQLRQAWAARFGFAPAGKSVALLRLNLAWRIQEAAYGGLGAEAKALLKRTGAAVAKINRLPSGTRLVREWQGVAHEVVVVDGRFAYAGKTWDSLSQIARYITGARWSGPRFFGLREKPA